MFTNCGLTMPCCCPCCHVGHHANGGPALRAATVSASRGVTPASSARRGAASAAAVMTASVKGTENRMGDDARCRGVQNSSAGLRLRLTAARTRHANNVSVTQCHPTTSDHETAFMAAKLNARVGTPGRLAFGSYTVNVRGRGEAPAAGAPVACTTLTATYTVALGRDFGDTRAALAAFRCVIAEGVVVCAGSFTNTPMCAILCDAPTARGFNARLSGSQFAFVCICLQYCLCARTQVAVAQLGPSSWRA